MAYSISFPNVDDLFNEDKAKAQEKELQTFLNCCKGNESFLKDKLFLSVVDGHRLSPDVCDPITEDVKRKVANYLFNLLYRGQKVNGKGENWHNGCFGSRWCDLDASRWGLTYVRCAFYTKQTYKKDWPYAKPYCIQITAELAKRDESEDESDAKCFWCNSTGVDKKSAEGKWVHAECE